MSADGRIELDRHTSAVVSLTESICGLPAVATLDWPDLAADSVASIGAGSVAVVQIATLDNQGRVQRVEATGAAASLDQVQASRIAGLRARADRLLSYEVAQDDLVNGSFVGILSEFSPGGDWQSTGIGSVFGEFAVGGVLVGVAHLGSVEPGRVLSALIAPTKSAVTTSHEAQLRGVMPLLVQRALLAIGPTATTAADWLTEREQQVLDQLALGKSVRQIAEAIDRSPHTVHDHVKSLHRKLNASSRGELISRALGHVARGVRIRRRTETASEVAAKPIAAPRLVGGTTEALEEGAVEQATRLIGEG